MKQQKLIPKPKKGEYINQDGVCPLKCENMALYRCEWCDYCKQVWATKGGLQIDGCREIIKFTVWCYYPNYVER